MLSTRLAGLIGRGVAAATRLRGGHGSALPGLVVEKIDPHFLRDVLGRLPLGCAVVTGTNGKTTTTKMVTELLQAAGLRVFTNPSGSNFTRGVVSAAIPQMRGDHLDADIAVVELDEAYAVHFVHQVPPRYCLLLNVLRDQLDRFGEIDTTAALLRQVAAGTSGAVVLNADDPRIAAFAAAAPAGATVSWFGLAPALREQFPTDEHLHDEGKDSAATPPIEPPDPDQQVTLSTLRASEATYVIEGQSHTTPLAAHGPHNALNGAAALALTRAILGPRFDASSQVTALGRVQAAFGRGEVWKVGDRTMRLTLVKNPSGFRLALAGADPALPTLVAINDHSADGRDVSWLWDVDFRPIAGCPLLVTSGIRATDMALRLEYDGLPVAWSDPDPVAAFERFCRDAPAGPIQVFSSYTAMLALRDHLKTSSTAAVTR